MLKGKVTTQVHGEAVNFICTTSITLFVLATKSMDEKEDKHIISWKSEEILESFHIFFAYCFGCLWTSIYVVNGLKYFGHFGGNKIVPPIDNKLCLRLLEGGRDRRSISSASNGRSGPFALSTPWRVTFAFLPCVLLPLISVLWIFKGDEHAPFPFLYMAFCPINILSIFVIFFSSPENSSNPVLEITTYMLGGPLVLVLGGIAEMRWNLENVTGFEDDKGTWADPTYFLLVGRLIFGFVLCAFLKLFLRLRLTIARTVPNIEGFVTETVFLGTLKALVPVSYVCFTSLSCIVTTYASNDHSSLESKIDSECFQTLLTR